jgi:hypothetical protein
MSNIRSNIRAIILEDGKLIHAELKTWVYTGKRGTFVGPTATMALAKAYNTDIGNVEVKILRFKDYGIKALVCIEGLCEIRDVELEESTPQS